MRLPPEGAQWLISLRWVACASVAVTIGVTSVLLDVMDLSGAAAGIGCATAMACYNLMFQLRQRDRPVGPREVERNIFVQIAFDLVALTLLLYFSDISRNPFLFFFVFHMIIASMYLHGRAPYLVAGMATVLVGATMWLGHLGWIPRFPIHLPTELNLAQPRPLDGLYLIGVFLAFASTLFFTVYFTVSMHRYVDRAHASLRQKEKMLGIGQLVASIGHQIANPLDGLQNCLRRIGEQVQHDEHLTEYVEMMTEALQRIERTTKRVQSFARPRGIKLQRTDVNRAVEGTLQVLGTGHGADVRIETQLDDVPAVLGDPYTLQEVLFNLCTNALAAMPDGGTLTLSTTQLGRQDDDQMDSVAIHVRDTGVGIPPMQLEKIFEPFYTTRGESGGTGLGLGLCRMLISEMGGRIEVHSALQRGTTFTVVLHPTDTENETEDKTEAEELSKRT